jgi:cytochrome c2
MKKLTTYFLATIISICILSFWIVFYKPPLIIEFAQPALKKIRIWLKGEEVYITKIFDNQTSVVVNALPLSKVIETSLLPIRTRNVSLPKDFAAGAGSIENVKGNLVAMSRTGVFYKYKDGNFYKLNWDGIPNNLEKYILYSNSTLSLGTMRVHSFAYDENSNKIFVAHTKYVSPKITTFAVSSLEINPKTFEKINVWKIEYESDSIYDGSPSISGGGKVKLRNGQLYFSVGYSSSSSLHNGYKVPAAQNPNSSFGKIFRMNIKSGEIQLISMGHRNVQGLAFTSLGELISAEHGLQGGDEINLVEKGANFGWPYISFGTDYGKYSYTPGADSKTKWLKPDGFKSVDPVYAFVPSVGLSPIHLIESFHSAWNGNFLAGSLKSQSLFRMVISSGKVILSEPIWIGHRIRDISFSPNNEIVLLTDDSLVIFLYVDETLLRDDKKNAGYNFDEKIQSCLKCHHFEQSTPSSLAPSLANVFGKKIGGDSFEKYSTAMMKATGFWDKQKLTAFLTDPQSVIPGTSMPNPELTQDEVREVVKILIK